MAPQTYPRCSPDLCVRCRKKFGMGDRVAIVHIVTQVGKNPDNPSQMGAWLSSEFEMAHIDCADAALNGRMLSL